MELKAGTEQDYSQLVSLWEASVRATHGFLNEEDILFFKKLIPDYLSQVRVFVVCDNNGKIIGFTGVSDNNLEMLFIHPDARGQGVGKILVNYVISVLGVKKVDVNEQNAQAVGFYLKMGYKVISRSETDGQGKPYPLLHMQY